MTQTKPAVTASSTGKWKAYPAYKNSGVEWLGEIPAHWGLERLKFNSYVKGRIGWQNLRSDEFTDEGPYLITGMHFNQGSIDWDACYHITKERYDMAPEIQVKVHDVLVTKDGSVGKIAYIEYLPGEASLNSHLLVIRPLARQYAPRYLYHLLRSSIFKSYILVNQAGSTFFGISQESVVNFPMILPTMPEQRAIATFLDRETAKVNTLIAKKERLIELLQEKRAALISHAVTKGLDPTVPMKDSGVEWLGEIPAHWEVKRLKHLGSIQRGRFSHRPRNDPQMYDGSYPFIQTGDITATAKYITDYQQTLNELGFAVSKQFPSGTLVMAIAANIGDLAILQFPACFPDSIVGFVPFPEVTLDYLYYNLTAMKQEMMSTATINTQLNLNVERIGVLFTTCPPISEQHAIATYLDHETAKIDTLFSRIRDGIEKLKEYSTALISAAVTGKIDVRGEIFSKDDETSRVEEGISTLN